MSTTRAVLYPCVHTVRIAAIKDDKCCPSCQQKYTRISIQPPRSRCEQIAKCVDAHIPIITITLYSNL